MEILKKNSKKKVFWVRDSITNKLAKYMSRQNEVTDLVGPCPIWPPMLADRNAQKVKMSSLLLL